MAERQLAEIRTAFAGVRLQERYEVAIEPVGECVVHRIVQNCPVSPPALPSPATVRRVLIGRLDLVRGIGPRIAARLSGAGVRTIEELTDPLAHPHHARAAAHVMDEIDSSDLLAISSRLRERFRGHGHLMSSLLAGMVGINDIAFIDTETLGLDNNMIFLIGIGRFVEGSFLVQQFLAPRHADESAILSRAIGSLGGLRVLVTYNGRTADLPWIASRCLYHGIDPPPEIAHIDLLYGTRYRYQRAEQSIPDARLPTVQSHLLGTKRPAHDVPSFMVPQLYDAYTQSPDDEGLLIPVIDHNRSDIEALAILLGKLCAEAADPRSSPEP
ncbi:MAG: ribonuclease H-like domain-containing protein [Acidimicrobiales bacterium]